jgi:GTP-binding protein LepA
VESKLFSVKNGQIKGQKKFMATGNEYFADEIGTEIESSSETSDFCRDVGYLISGIKSQRSKVGDTLTDAKHPPTTILLLVLKM